jgi:acetyltransferase-like isoleucine patch superfamily enzyme
MKKIVYSRVFLWLISAFMSIFYDKSHLKGKYFYEKRMGWLWAFKGLPSRLIGKNRKVPWPVSKYCTISNFRNIEFHPDSINIFQSFGTYYQSHDAKIRIGKNVHIAPNVGIITTNHDIYNPAKHVCGKDITIGDNSWIGMNSVILPGVTLGINTIVGAGSIVTKSFEQGNCVIAGVPARVIKHLDIDSNRRMEVDISEKL